MRPLVVVGEGKPSPRTGADGFQGGDGWRCQPLLRQFLLRSCGADSSQGSWVSSLAGLFSAVLVHQNLLSGRGREHG